jgi:hypothetical protein
MPSISGSLVDQDESIAEATDGEPVPKSGIHVHGIKVLLYNPIKRSTSVGFA